MKRVLGTALGAALLVAALAVPAWADAANNHWSDSRSTVGGDATCNLYTVKFVIHDDGTRIRCNIADTADDGDSVYVVWQNDGYPNVSIRDDNGPNTDVVRCDPSPCGQNLYNFYADGSIQTIVWRVCRDRGFPFSDVCSSWVTHNP
jgi:hypothetical protein